MICRIAKLADGGVGGGGGGIFSVSLNCLSSSYTVQSPEPASRAENETLARKTSNWQYVAES